MWNVAILGLDNRTPREIVASFLDYGSRPIRRQRQQELLRRVHRVGLDADA